MSSWLALERESEAVFGSLTMRDCGIADIFKLKTEKGLALQDVILGIYDFVATVEFKPQARVYLLDQLAQVEYACSTCFSAYEHQVS